METEVIFSPWSNILSPGAVLPVTLGKRVAAYDHLTSGLPLNLEDYLADTDGRVSVPTLVERNRDQMTIFATVDGYRPALLPDNPTDGHEDRLLGSL